MKRLATTRSAALVCSGLLFCTAARADIAFNSAFAGAYDYVRKPDFAVLMQQFLQGLPDGGAPLVEAFLAWCDKSRAPVAQDLARLRADLNAFLYALFQTVRAEPGRGQQAAQPNAARAAYAAPYANLGSPYSERMALLVAETAAGHVTPELREAFARLQLHPSADGRPAAAEAGGTDTTALHELLHTWSGMTTQRTRLLIAYGGEPWYNRALLAGGCKLAEEVIFFELPHLHRSAPELQIPSSPTAVRATVRSATVADIGALALLDAACFNVLWHMGPADLRQLVLFGNLTLAEMEGSLAGYLAMTTRGSTAQVARLAVHPAWTGHGIGRELLTGGLRAAADLGCRSAVLNTQADNQRAQTLYRSLGFHPTGERFEVYTRLAPAE